MEFKGKKVAVVGLGITGKALIKFLLKKKAFIVACDQNRKIDPSLRKLPIKFSLGKNYLKNSKKTEIIFISPGVPLNLSPFKKLKSKITNEIALFLELCPAPVIGITGTNGKTTTTTLVSKILKEGRKKVFMGGNIGEPLINKIDKITKKSWVVLEISSFQLELVKRSPQIAVVLNITPDHLDRYKNFGQYKKAKEKIILYQKKNDYAILNFDDKNVLALKQKTPAQIYGFSTLQALKRGAYLKDQNLVIRDKNKLYKICSVSEIKLPGQHNIANILAASLVGYLCRIPLSKIRKVIANFQGIPHRLELVRIKNKIKFYNDSKSTTPASTIAALKSFSEPIILIAGGYDKKSDFSLLAKEIKKKVKKLILIGQTAQKIALAVKKEKPSLPQYFTKSLKEAIQLAYRNAHPYEVVLFSPACASFDMFTNFEERGELFKKLVKELK